jgi:hypothetical protein
VTAGAALRPELARAADRMMSSAVPDSTYTAAELDAALEALREPDRLTHAQEIVTHSAPSLQRMLAQALDAGGWFGSAHETQVAQAAGGADVQERVTAVRMLVAEETRLAMLVGVAVGFELAHELQAARGAEGAAPSSTQADTVTEQEDE